MTKQIITTILFLLIFMSSIGNASEISIRGGSIASDLLGGVGGHKSMVEANLLIDSKFISFDSTLWKIAELLDDDIGIVPESGFSLTATVKRNILRLGIHHEVMDSWKESYLVAGIGNKHGKALLLIPSGNARYGIIMEVNSATYKKFFITSKYNYTGRQDPDIKIFRISFGIGREF